MQKKKEFSFITMDMEYQNLLQMVKYGCSIGYVLIYYYSKTFVVYGSWIIFRHILNTFHCPFMTYNHGWGHHLFMCMIVQMLEWLYNYLINLQNSMKKKIRSVFFPFVLFLASGIFLRSKTKHSYLTFTFVWNELLMLWQLKHKIYIDLMFYFNEILSFIIIKI